MATIDGSIQLVKVVTDAELRQNGGSFVVAGRMAQPIQGFDTLTKRAGGGNAIPVYVVSDAQIADGTFRLKGGSALPMADIDVVAAGVKTIQGTAIPVYVVSGSLAGAGGAAVTYLFRDIFTDANGTAITAHTPDIDLVGGGWSESTAGKFDIQGNRSNIKAAGSTDAAYVDVGVADFKITADVITTATGAAAHGVIFRFSNTSNFWLARWLIGSDELQLYERQVGVFTKRASAALVGDPGDPYTIEVTASGTDITVAVNGTTISYSSAFNQAVTNVGMSPGGGVTDVGGGFDNFDVINFP